MSVNDLVQAACNGKIVEVTGLLNSGIPVDGLHSSGKYNALYGASGNGHEAVVRLLLSRGANVNLTQLNGWTALMNACGNGHVSTSELLLLNGADHTHQNQDGCTALHVACQNGHAEIVGLLLRYGASVQSRNQEGKIPIEMCTDATKRAKILAVFASHPPSVPPLPTPAAEIEQLRVEVATLTTARDSLQRQLTETATQLTQAVAARDAINTQLTVRTTERDVALAERDAAVAERDQLRAQVAGMGPADGCPFQRFQPHSFAPGVVPPGSGPGLHDVANTSSLFLYLRQLSETGGTWTINQRPIAGFRLTRVQAVVPEPYILGGYTNAQARLNALRASGGAHFNHDTQGFSLAQLSVLNQLREMFQEKAPGCSNRTVNTLYCYHGPRREHLESICSNGMVAVGGMDAGFFGSGCYTTLNMEYAVKYAYGDFDLDADGFPTGPRTTPEGLYPIIMLAATVGMAYPVTREVDYLPNHTRSEYFGRPLKRGFDAHVVCVNQPACQAVSREQCEYVELVIEQQAQLLPLAVLWFEKL